MNGYDDFSQAELDDAVQLYALNMISHVDSDFRYGEDQEAIDERSLIKVSLIYPETIDLIDKLRVSSVEYQHGKEQEKTA